MRRLDFFVALNRPWQLIKTLKLNFVLGDWHSLQKVHGRLKCLTSKEYFPAVLHLFSRKPLLGNLFVVDRIFFDDYDLKIFNIVIHENWKLLEVETVQISTSSFDYISDNFFRFTVYCFNQHCEKCKGFFEQKIER